MSTDCPSGPREILHGKLAQWLVPCNDVNALTRAMQHALMLPVPDSARITAAVAPYTADRVLDAWEALAHEIST